VPAVDTHLPAEVCRALDALAEHVQYAIPVRDENGEIQDFRDVWANAAYLRGSKYSVGGLISKPAQYCRGRRPDRRVPRGAGDG
jgi:hypothetical protein